MRETGIHYGEKKIEIDIIRGLIDEFNNYGELINAIIYSSTT